MSHVIIFKDMSRFSSKQLLPLVGSKRNKQQQQANTIYAGSLQCQETRKSGQPCPNQAYYEQRGSYRCGAHSQAGVRTKLPLDTNKQQCKIDALKQHRVSVLQATEANAKIGARGEVQLQAMAMMKPVPLVRGWLNVFPNNKHQSRVDGFGCASLSPMQLGPVHHQQPGLPPARNIENYHQFNKVWPCEVDKADKERAPRPEFFTLQRQAYDDPVPHRHKFEPAQMAKQRKKLDASGVSGQRNKNAPLYSLHLTLDGSQRRFSYVQSRYFYCCAYEKLAKQQPDYEKLVALRDSGCNLMLCGYDATPVNAETKSLDEMYADEGRPFGHELVLYSLLTVSEPIDYPWHKYRAQHPEVYENVAHVFTL